MCLGHPEKQDANVTEKQDLQPMYPSSNELRMPNMANHTQIMQESLKGVWKEL